MSQVVYKVECQNGTVVIFDRPFDTHTCAKSCDCTAACAITEGRAVGDICRFEEVRHEAIFGERATRRYVDYYRRDGRYLKGRLALWR